MRPFGPCAPHAAPYREDFASPEAARDWFLWFTRRQPGTRQVDSYLPDAREYATKCPSPTYESDRARLGAVPGCNLAQFGLWERWRREYAVGSTTLGQLRDRSRANWSQPAEGIEYGEFVAQRAKEKQARLAAAAAARRAAPSPHAGPSQQDFDSQKEAFEWFLWFTRDQPAKRRVKDLIANASKYANVCLDGEDHCRTFERWRQQDRMWAALAKEYGALTLEEARAKGDKTGPFWSRKPKWSDSHPNGISYGGVIPNMDYVLRQAGEKRRVQDVRAKAQKDGGSHTQSQDVAVLRTLILDSCKGLARRVEFPKFREAVENADLYWIDPKRIHGDMEHLGSGYSGSGLAARLDGREDVILKSYHGHEGMIKSNEFDRLASMVAFDCILPMAAREVAHTDAIMGVRGWTVLEGHGPCVVSERLRGGLVKGAFDTWMRAMPEDWKRRFAVGMARRLRDAIRALHKLGASHCDLDRLQNIMFREKVGPTDTPEFAASQVVLIDFGRSYQWCNPAWDVAQVIRNALMVLGSSSDPDLKARVDSAEAMYGGLGGPREWEKASALWGVLETWLGAAGGRKRARDDDDERGGQSKEARMGLY